MTNPTNMQSNQADSDEIILHRITAALVRHIVLVGSITIAAAVLSGFYAFTRKPVWEGSFQIVLEDQSTSSGGRLAQLAAASPMLANLAGLGSGTLESSLATEVMILESPSVLKPVYDFVKSNKAAAGKDVSNWVYSDWVNSNLTVELTKGTSVLNLFYRDSDENLILPVLKRISEAYQEYSNRDSARSIDNSLKFATEQSKILKAKAKESNHKLDIFKFTYGISDDGGSEIGSSQFNIYSSPLPQLSRGRDPLEELSNINKKLTRRLQFYTESDPSVVRLQKERSAILQYIDETGGGLISIAGGGTKEINREILLNYKELQRTAIRDSTALSAMESQLLTLQIQKAQIRQPWDLISTPTVLDKPVAPRKKRLVVLGFFGGLALGCGAALFVDRRKGLVYNEDELKSLLPCPLIIHLPADAQDKWSDAADLLAEGPLKKVSGESAVGLIPLGKIPSNKLQAFSKELASALKGQELVVTTDLRKTSRCTTQLFITSPGAATRTQLTQFSQELALQGTPITGLILLDPNLNLS